MGSRSEYSHYVGGTNEMSISKKVRRPEKFNNNGQLDWGAETTVNKGKKGGKVDLVEYVLSLSFLNPARGRTAQAPNHLP